MIKLGCKVRSISSLDNWWKCHITWILGLRFETLKQFAILFTKSIPSILLEVVGSDVNDDRVRIWEVSVLNIIRNLSQSATTLAMVDNIWIARQSLSVNSPRDRISKQMNLGFLTSVFEYAILSFTFEVRVTLEVRVSKDTLLLISI